MTGREPQSDPEFLAAYGEAVASLRAERNLDRKQLAGAAGISYSYLSAIESGQKLPSPKLEMALAAALGVARTDLLARANGAITPHEIERAETQAPLHSEARLMRRSVVGRAAPGPPRLSETDEGLSASAAMAELGVLVHGLSPPDAALVVSLARRLSLSDNPQAGGTPHRSPWRQSSGSSGANLRTTLYLSFWTDFVTKVSNRGLDWVEGRRPEPRSYFTMASPISGASISSSFARNRLLRHELYINRGSREANLDVLRRLASHRDGMERAYGRPIEFEDPGRERRAVRIAEYRKGHISLTEEHGDYIEWFIDAGLRMRRAIDVVLGADGGF